MTTSHSLLARAAITASLCLIAPASAAQAPTPARTSVIEPAPLARPPRAASADPSTDAVRETPLQRSPPVRASERPRVVVWTILGLVLLLGLAYAGGHPRVEAIERSLGISQAITAGFPFVAIGVAARVSGLLTADTLSLLGPLLRFGLGWIGFILGFRFNARLLDTAPRGVGTLVAVRAFATVTLITGAAALVRYLTRDTGDPSVTHDEFLRDALVLGTAGALTSSTTSSHLRTRGADEASVELVSSALHLESLAGVVGLLFIASYFRPHDIEVAWHMPGTAWLLLALGLGAAMGAVIYAVFRQGPATGPGSTVLTLGSVAFASGMAGNLRLSAVVTCFCAGLVLANAPGEYKPRLTETLDHLERPIYLLFLAVVGALWHPGAWPEWCLMGAFVLARLVGKSLGTHLGAERAGVSLSLGARRELSVAPMGALPLAIVVSAMLLYPGEPMSHLVTAILGGAIVTELIVQSVRRPSSGEGAG